MGFVFSAHHQYQVFRHNLPETLRTDRCTLGKRTLFPRTPLMTTLHGYRGILLDYVGDPTSSPGALRLEEDGLLIVQDGMIHARGSYSELCRLHPQIDLVDYRGKLILPGFI